MYFVKFFCFIYLSMNSIKIFIEKESKTDLLFLDKKSIQSIEDLYLLINKKYGLDNNYFLTVTQKTNKIVTDKNIDELMKSDELRIKLNFRLKGGLGIALFAILIFPMIFIGKAFMRLGDVLEKFFNLFIQVIQLIPLIFDPPRLIDDILFGVTFGINQMFRAMSDSASGLTSTPEDDEAGGGATFDLDKETPTKCMSPTFTTILMLIICPPLAIFLKLGFWKGFVSAIICGVLCVKLFYFPGLLFAILHVLC